jgi:hypothetical protein
VVDTLTAFGAGLDETSMEVASLETLFAGFGASMDVSETAWVPSD